MSIIQDDKKNQQDQSGMSGSVAQSSGAIGSSAQPQQQDQQQDQQSNAPQGGATFGGGTQASPTGAGQQPKQQTGAGPQSSQKAAGSGRFAGLQKFIRGNQGRKEGLTNQMTQNIQESGQQSEQQRNLAQNQAQQQIQQGTNIQGYGQQDQGVDYYQNQAQQTLDSANQGQQAQNMEQYNQLINAQYAGPADMQAMDYSGMEGVSNYQDLAGQQDTYNQSIQNSLTDEGRGQLVQDIYGTGQSRSQNYLDNLLVQKSKGEIMEAANPYLDSGDKFQELKQQTASNAANRASELQQIRDTTRTGLSDSLSTTQSDIDTDVNTDVQNVGAVGDYLRDLNLENSQDLSTVDQELLGLKEGDIMYDSNVGDLFDYNKSFKGVDKQGGRSAFVDDADAQRAQALNALYTQAQDANFGNVQGYDLSQAGTGSVDNSLGNIREQVTKGLGTARTNFLDKVGSANYGGTSRGDASNLFKTTSTSGKQGFQRLGQNLSIKSQLEGQAVQDLISQMTPEQLQETSYDDIVKQAAGLGGYSGTAGTDAWSSSNQLADIALNMQGIAENDIGGRVKGKWAQLTRADADSRVNPAATIDGGFSYSKRRGFNSRPDEVAGVKNVGTFENPIYESTGSTAYQTGINNMGWSGTAGNEGFTSNSILNSLQNRGTTGVQELDGVVRALGGVAQDEQASLEGRLGEGLSSLNRRVNTKSEEDISEANIDRYNSLRDILGLGK
jgi:hypothetical protein